MRTRELILSLCMLATLCTGDAVADDEGEERASETIVLQSSQRYHARSLLADRAVVPGYWDLGTHIKFITPSKTVDGLQLPGIVRLGFSGRISLTERLELSGQFALPPKQTNVTDAPPLFGGDLMARVAIGRRHSLYLGTSARRLLQLAGPRDDGVLGAVAMGWDGRSFMDLARRFSFSWNVGAGAGRVFSAAEPVWLAEAIAGLGLTGAFIRGNVGFTLGADFRFPVVSGGRAYWMVDMPSINPQTRVDLYGTLFVSLATGWNVTTTFTLGDRGDLNHPETILPTLDGGYDQTQFMVSFSYSGIRKKTSKQAGYAARTNM